jgi:MFS family permease
LNKPVTVSEEALVVPVLVPEVTAEQAAKAAAAGPAYIVLAGISFSHFLNDTMQSLIASVYPILKDNYALDFAQIGMITLAFQFTASLLQPVIGYFTDKKAQPFSLAVGMGFTFFGLLLLSVAHHYGIILIAGVAGRAGLGRVPSGVGAHRAAASGGRYGFAQSVFQLGGSFGTSMGPVLAALIVVAVRPALDRLVLDHRVRRDRHPDADRHLVSSAGRRQEGSEDRSCIRIIRTPAASGLRWRVLVALLFSKQLYVSSLSSYYIFYLIDKFGVSTQARSSISSSSWRRTRSAPISAARSATASAANTSSGSRSSARCPSRWRCPMPGLRRARADRVHRPDHLLGDLVDHRVRAGADAAPLRHDLRRVLRRRLRHRRARALRCSASSPTTPRSAFVYHLCAFLPAIGCSPCFLPKDAAAAALKRNVAAAQTRAGPYQYIVSNCGGFARFAVMPMHHSQTGLSPQASGGQKISTLIIRVK